jgi:hypothetical protein
MSVTWSACSAGVTALDHASATYRREERTVASTDMRGPERIACTPSIK